MIARSSGSRLLHGVIVRGREESRLDGDCLEELLVSQNHPSSTEGRVQYSLLTTSVTLILPSLSSLISCFFVSNCPDPSRSLIYRALVPNLTVL